PRARGHRRPMRRGVPAGPARKRTDAPCALIQSLPPTEPNEITRALDDIGEEKSMLPPILHPGIRAGEGVIEVEQTAMLRQLQQLSMQLRGTIADRVDIDNARGRRRIGRGDKTIDACRQNGAGRTSIRGKPRNARAVKQKYIVELIQQTQVWTVPVERAGPKLEDVCHCDLAATAPVTDTRELDKTLRAPCDEKEEVVVLVERYRLDGRGVLQSQSLANTVCESVEVALDIVAVVGRQKGLELFRLVVVDVKRDEMRIIAFGHDAAELVGQRKMRPVLRIELGGNQGSTLQGCSSGSDNGLSILDSHLLLCSPGADSLTLVRFHRSKGSQPQNHVRRFFCDHEDSGGSVCRRHRRHDGRVRNSQTFQPVNSQLIVDNRARLLPRTILAGSGQVIGRQSGLARKFQAISVGDDRGTGQLFGAMIRLKRRSGE